MSLPDNMKTLVLSLLTLLILLVMILWMAGTFEHKIAPGINAVSEQNASSTITVALEQIPLFEEATGSIQSKQTTDVAAQIQSRVKAIYVKSGELIKPGQLLITLDAETLQARSAQANENLNAINARLMNAQLHHERIRNLYSKESATLAALEQADADYQSLKSQYAAAQQLVNEARHIQDYSQIKAGSVARVIDRFVEPGDVVSPGMKLLAVYDPQSVRIEAYVRESVAVGLSIGQTLEARIDALNTAVPATITEIVPSATPGARSVLIKTRIEHRPDMVPGLFARIRIHQGEERILPIPQAYIRQVGQLDVVWVWENKQFNRRFIRLGRALADGRVNVISGLSGGEKLILPDDVLAASRSVH
jgi:RND family efflux transporter MFP subunit